MENREYASTFVMSELRDRLWRSDSDDKVAIEDMLQHSSCQNFRTDCKDLIAMIKEPYAFWYGFQTLRYYRELCYIRFLLWCVI